jgi:hypothetical protein
MTICDLEFLVFVDVLLFIVGRQVIQDRMCIYSEILPVPFETVMSWL